jgi:hypothetical protein
LYLQSSLERVTIDDGIKAVLTLSKVAEGRHELADATGGTVLVQLTRSERFLTGAEKVRPQADQPDLPLDDTEDDPPPMVEAAPDTRPVPAGETQYEIKPWKDGFLIYRDDMPIAGAQKFATHDAAEKYLQEHLGVAQKPSVFERAEPAEPVPYEQMKAPALRALIKERTGKGIRAGISNADMIAMLTALDDTEKAPPEAESQEAVAPPPDLDEAKAAFAAAALAEARKDDRDWEGTWARLAAQYPDEFVDEHYDALSKAFADSWNEALG